MFSPRLAELDENQVPLAAQILPTAAQKISNVLNIHPSRIASQWLFNRPKSEWENRIAGPLGLMCEPADAAMRALTQ